MNHDLFRMELQYGKAFHESGCEHIAGWNEDERIDGMLANAEAAYLLGVAANMDAMPDEYRGRLIHATVWLAIVTGELMGEVKGEKLQRARERWRAIQWRIAPAIQ